MPTSPQLIEKKYTAIRQRYRILKEKNKKWQIDFIIEQVAEEFFLSPVTVAKILFNEGENNIPNPRTISRRMAAA